jgi:hypothetical protein
VGATTFAVGRKIKKRQQDLQELIPESQRDLVDAVLKGFFNQFETS